MRELLTDVNDYDLCITEFLRVVDQLLPAKSFYRLCPELPRQPHTVGHAGARTAASSTRSGWRRTPRAVELGSYGVDPTAAARPSW